MARPVPLADPLAEVVTYEERMPVVLRRRGCLMTVRIVSVDEPPAPESPPVPRAARPDQTGVGGASGGGGSGSGSLSVSPATTGPPPLLSRRSVDESAMACGHRRPLVRHSSDDTRRRRESFAAGGPAHSSASSIGLGHGSGEGSNLLRMRRSNLGRSAPSLSASLKELNISKRSSRAHRRSVIVTSSPTLPRCHSPMPGSPVDSPKNMSPNQHFAFAAVKRTVDGRRWSVASLPSSGYGTTPGSSNVSSQCSSQERLHQLHCCAQPPPPPAPVTGDLARHFSSNESNPSLEEEGRSSPLVRPRSRSLSSPMRTPLIDNDVVIMNTLYKERFPKATQQMEDRLQKLIEENEVTDLETEDSSPSAVAILRFVRHQVMEMVRDCLSKSQERCITSRYFYDLSENLEKLLNETREKSAEAARRVSSLVRRLLLIISRPARLLECLEFDPEEFYHLLERAEGQARSCQGITTDIPQYIVSKLGLKRDPLAELTEDLVQMEEEASASAPPQASTPKKADGEDAKPMRRTVHKVASEDDYERVKLISNGAYGAVYLVRQRGTRQRFALKRISKQNVVLRNQMEQVLAERDIMSFTDNPFVVSMYCSFETKRHLCMVMEYVEGGDCACLLKNIGILPADMARLYFAETVLAVEYLHSFGIVHRDLKPDNLLITSMGHIKLTDFGLSKMGLMSLATNLYEGYIDKETKQFSDKQVFGTPEYIAPEVILRQGYGKPVDWWSMGIILYEFLVGCVPFFGDTPEELFAHTVNDDIEWPSDEEFQVLPEARDLISQLLQQTPLERLGTGGAQEVKDHAFFLNLDWTNLLRQKVEFVPQLEDDEDTSYFDTRADRYNHDLEDDTDDTEESLLFSSFSSCSPRFKKSQGRLDLRKSMSQGDSGQSDQSESSAAGSGEAADSGRLARIQHVSSLPDVPLRLWSGAAGPGLGRSPFITPDSSQTESEDVSPQVQRRRRHREPRPAVAVDKADGGSTGTDHVRELSPVEESEKSPPRNSPTVECGTAERAARSGPGAKTTAAAPATTTTTPATAAPAPTTTSSAPAAIGTLAGPAAAAGGERPAPTGGSLRPPTAATPPPPIIRTPGGAPPLPAGARPKASSPMHRVIKSASASGLNLMIPPEDACPQPVQSPGGSSTASSRDASPCRELSPLLNNLKPPVILRRGARGFGFTIRAIRVYLGDSDYYTVHHLVMTVDSGSPAFDAGLRPGDLITHINDEPVQGLFHTQVLQLLLSGGDRVTLRATPLDQTSISSGGRKRAPGAAKLARRAGNRRKRKESSVDKRRKASLLRKLSSKRASAEIHQMASNSPMQLTPSRSFSSLSRSVSCEPGAAARPAHRLSHSDSSNSSSPSSSVPNSPAAAAAAAAAGQFQPRPSSLHGLKHKLHAATKSAHAASRRKSVGHIPLSPLARTPSPSPLPVSPTRSPSPLAFPVAHTSSAPACSVQSYSPGAASLAPTAAAKAYMRPKSAEPGSPLLRRALSPDRLHRADGRPAISPLVSSPPPRVTVTAQSPPPTDGALTSSDGGASPDLSRRPRAQPHCRHHRRPGPRRPDTPPAGTPPPAAPPGRSPARAEQTVYVSTVTHRPAEAGDGAGEKPPSSSERPSSRERSRRREGSLRRRAARVEPEDKVTAAGTASPTRPPPSPAESRRSAQEKRTAYRNTSATTKDDDVRP
ncbi:microtubule-associated serine/threonine-protein kinase 3-like isoform X3 [Amphibalanus amphitrite]|uniref:microtubule-associated serine/threonine-protein kinase 3-like isoform X3 n=1 Tax=Amphibalanus amphitrite TaxID=1232801 RepID=UPI001C902951|nr:microtubule-associated serine/threonine-protein kinase 3-like isoform X3 [Amphibalanus amphitrite]